MIAVFHPRDIMVIPSPAMDRRKLISEAWLWALSSVSVFWFSFRKSSTYFFPRPIFSALNRLVTVTLVMDEVSKTVSIDVSFFFFLTRKIFYFDKTRILIISTTHNRHRRHHITILIVCFEVRVQIFEMKFKIKCPSIFPK